MQESDVDEARTAMRIAARRLKADRWAARFYCMGIGGFAGWDRGWWALGYVAVVTGVSEMWALRPLAASSSTDDKDEQQ